MSAASTIAIPALGHAELVMREVPCPLCESTSSAEVMRGPDWYYGVPGTFRVVRCGDCGHTYLNPCPTDNELARCYPDGYSAHRSRQPKEAGPTPPTFTATASAKSRTPWYLASWFRRIPGPRWLYYWLTDTKSHFIPAGSTGRRALELGCATGDFLLILKQQGWDAEGVDIVESAVRAAEERGLSVRRGDPTTIELRAATYDYVFAWMVVEHLPRPRSAFDRVHAALKQGGAFCFSVPNFASWERRLWGSHWKGTDLPRHLQHFTPRTLRKLLGSSGFKDVTLIYQPSFLYWLGSQGSWLVARKANSRLGALLLKWFYDNPPLWTYFVFGPLAHLSAALRQSGRLTIVAHKSVSEQAGR